jgi:hypothetical protein
VRKSIADEDEAIEAWESSKLSDILDPEASGTGLWERTETSLGVGGGGPRKIHIVVWKRFDWRKGEEEEGDAAEASMNSPPFDKIVFGK